MAIEEIPIETVVTDPHAPIEEPEPAAKLEKKYEDAMADSDLAPFEKEMIRLIVEKEKKTFAEALESVRPGYTAVEEEVPAKPSAPKQVTPSKQETVKQPVKK